MRILYYHIMQKTYRHPDFCILKKLIFPLTVKPGIVKDFKTSNN